MKTKTIPILIKCKARITQGEFNSAYFEVLPDSDTQVYVTSKDRITALRFADSKFVCDNK